MRAGKDLINKPIISVTDGKFLGNVKDLLLDANVERLEGIFLGTEGLLRRKFRFVHRDDVFVFGVDAILVKNSDVTIDSSQDQRAKSWLRRSKLEGREIDTPGGTRVGKLGDIIVDEEAQIIGVNLSRTMVEGPIAERQTISRTVFIDVGREDGAMTIDLSAAEHTPMGAALAIARSDGQVEASGMPADEADKALAMVRDERSTQEEE